MLLLVMFFDSLKGSVQTQQSILSATLQKALEKEYGSKVSKEDVDKAYKQASEQYGINSHKYLPMVKQSFKNCNQPYTKIGWVCC